MKPKKNKKLSFNKSTIADLNFKKLNEVRGGKDLTTQIGNCNSCITCYYTCEGFTCPATCDQLTCFHEPGTACLD
jgi:hypothetical protein